MPRGFKKVETTLPPEEPGIDKRPALTALLKNAGRPPKHTEASLAEETLKYLDSTERSRTIPNKAGLMVWLGISRETYSEYRRQFPDTINIIDHYIEEAWVQRLSGQSPAGAIFYLKNAFKEDYRDRHETDITTNGDKIQTTATEITQLASSFDEFFKKQNGAAETPTVTEPAHEQIESAGEGAPERERDESVAQGVHGEHDALPV